MGKRKLHNQNYFQCDWTGLPMKTANCFMPGWTLDDKLIKKGSYCNWESVIAHAQHIYHVEKQLEDKDLERIWNYVKTQMGGIIHSTTAPHFTDLEHFKSEGTRNLTASEYHTACCYQTDEVSCVKITESGHAFELLLDPHEGKFDFSKYIKSSAKCEQEPSKIHPYRRGKHKEMELCVFYYPDRRNGLELNTLASALFKMQVYGEILLVQCTKEASFMPRERYVNYTLQEFQDNFVRKRKRSTQDTASMNAEEYGVIKAEMQQSLCAFEQQVSSQAKPPPSLVKAAKLPPTNGRDLARLVKHERGLPLEAAA